MNETIEIYEETEQAATTPLEKGPVAEEETVADPEPRDGLQEQPFTLPVKFNKQEYQLSVEDATVYAQKGMKYTAMEPMLEQLRSLAQAKGQSSAAFVQGLCGEERDINERLAEEYGRLREECPELDTFDKVPKTVVQTAVESGMPLLYAYLRYHYEQHNRIARARAAAAAAEQASAGTQRGETNRTPDPAVAAMVRGIWG